MYPPSTAVVAQGRRDLFLVGRRLGIHEGEGARRRASISFDGHRIAACPETAEKYGAVGELRGRRRRDGVGDGVARYLRPEGQQGTAVGRVVAVDGRKHWLVDYAIGADGESVDLHAPGHDRVQHIGACLVNPWIGDRRVAHRIACPEIGYTEGRRYSYLCAPTASHQRCVREFARREHLQGVVGGVEVGAAARHRRYQPYGVHPWRGEGVRGTRLCRGAAVAEIPQIGGSASGVLQVHRVWSATRGGWYELGHREVVSDVETEDGVVAVAREVAVAPGIGGGGESLGAAA